MHVAPCCQLPDATCRGLWAAAGTANQRRRANQHITGRSFAVDARHGGPLAAANLVGTGELYAYALCLVSRLLELKGVGCVSCTSTSCASGGHGAQKCWSSWQAHLTALTLLSNSCISG